MDPVVIVLLALLLAVVGNGRPSTGQRDVLHAAAIVVGVLAALVAA